MNKVKIVHAADIHFDSPFAGFSIKESDVFNEELKEVFHNIINICKENSVDILLLAGDIFDNNTIKKSTLAFIENELNLIKNIYVFISPGNHDPYSNKSFYSLINWPENVYIFKGALEKVYIEKLGVNVYGGAFTEKYCLDSMLKSTSADQNINIMVMHGDLNVNNSSYNPIMLENIKESKMDYIALGHIHNYSGINKIENTYYAYSGCPQGRGFDETGDKGIIIGEVAKGFAKLDFLKTSIREYRELKVDITNVNSYEEIINKIKANVNLTDIYKIVLVGEIDESFEINQDILKERLLKIIKYFKIKDETSYAYDLEEIEKGYSVKGIFVKNMRRMINVAENDDEKEILEMALKYGISSLSDREVKN